MFTQRLSKINLLYVQINISWFSQFLNTLLFVVTLFTLVPFISTTTREIPLLNIAGKSSFCFTYPDIVLPWFGPPIILLGILLFLLAIEIVTTTFTHAQKISSLTIAVMAVLEAFLIFGHVHLLAVVLPWITVTFDDGLRLLADPATTISDTRTVVAATCALIVALAVPVAAVLGAVTQTRWPFEAAAWAQFPGSVAMLVPLGLILVRTVHSVFGWAPVVHHAVGAVVFLLLGFLIAQRQPFYNVRFNHGMAGVFMVAGAFSGIALVHEIMVFTPPFAAAVSMYVLVGAVAAVTGHSMSYLAHRRIILRAYRLIDHKRRDQPFIFPVVTRVRMGRAVTVDALETLHPSLFTLPAPATRLLLALEDAARRPARFVSVLAARLKAPLQTAPLNLRVTSRSELDQNELITAVCWFIQHANVPSSFLVPTSEAGRRADKCIQQTKGSEYDVVSELLNIYTAYRPGAYFPRLLTLICGITLKSMCITVSDLKTLFQTIDSSRSVMAMPYRVLYLTLQDMMKSVSRESEDDVGPNGTELVTSTIEAIKAFEEARTDVLAMAAVSYAHRDHHELTFRNIANRATALGQLYKRAEKLYKILQPTLIDNQTQLEECARFIQQQQMVRRSQVVAAWNTISSLVSVSSAGIKHPGLSARLASLRRRGQHLAVGVGTAVCFALVVLVTAICIRSIHEVTGAVIEACDIVQLATELSVGSQNFLLTSLGLLPSTSATEQQDFLVQGAADLLALYDSHVGSVFSTNTLFTHLKAFESSYSPSSERTYANELFALVTALDVQLDYTDESTNAAYYTAVLEGISQQPSLPDNGLLRAAFDDFNSMKRAVVYVCAATATLIFMGAITIIVPLRSLYFIVDRRNVLLSFIASVPKKAFFPESPHMGRQMFISQQKVGSGLPEPVGAAHPILETIEQKIRGINSALFRLIFGVNRSVVVLSIPLAIAVIPTVLHFYQMITVIDNNHTVTMAHSVVMNLQALAADHVSSIALTAQAMDADDNLDQLFLRAVVDAVTPIRSLKTGVGADAPQLSEIVVGQRHLAQIAACLGLMNYDNTTIPAICPDYRSSDDMIGDHPVLVRSIGYSDVETDFALTNDDRKLVIRSILFRMLARVRETGWIEMMHSAWQGTVGAVAVIEYRPVRGVNIVLGIIASVSALASWVYLFVYRLYRKPVWLTDRVAYNIVVLHFALIIAMGSLVVGFSAKAPSAVEFTTYLEATRGRFDVVASLWDGFSRSDLFLQKATVKTASSLSAWLSDIEPVELFQAPLVDDYYAAWIQGYATTAQSDMATAILALGDDAVTMAALVIAHHTRVTAALTASIAGDVCGHSTFADLCAYPWDVSAEAGITEQSYLRCETMESCPETIISTAAEDMALDEAGKVEIIAMITQSSVGTLLDLMRMGDDQMDPPNLLQTWMFGLKFPHSVVVYVSVVLAMLVCISFSLVQASHHLSKIHNRVKVRFNRYCTEVKSTGVHQPATHVGNRPQRLSQSITVSHEQLPPLANTTIVVVQKVRTALIVGFIASAFLMATPVVAALLYMLHASLYLHHRIPLEAVLSNTNAATLSALKHLMLTPTTVSHSVQGKLLLSSVEALLFSTYVNSDTPSYADLYSANLYLLTDYASVLRTMELCEPLTRVINPPVANTGLSLIDTARQDIAMLAKKILEHEMVAELFEIRRTHTIRDDVLTASFLDIEPGAVVSASWVFGQWASSLDHSLTIPGPLAVTEMPETKILETVAMLSQIHSYIDGQRSLISISIIQDNYGKVFVGIVVVVGVALVAVMGGLFAAMLLVEEIDTTSYLLLGIMPPSVFVALLDIRDSSSGTIVESPTETATDW
ncbi:hypothetical protein J8273_1722 [Carpediemonas membranifera]|uniref:Transmembrane protein n=1 Tax=Carpediemonas membranifera TaxID=201153 RepID=A0A8J6BAJ6_9EUKA|nr:hypothetical protein J8273_1722 [Carpediemonas membranifera]|eukprot:KAG9396704.1 hypothetical protein J8273_1722 [Carpediemonas membranifera]